MILNGFILVDRQLLLLKLNIKLRDSELKMIWKEMNESRNFRVQMNPNHIIIIQIMFLKAALKPYMVILFYLG